MTNKDEREAPDNQELVTRQTYNDFIECRRKLSALEQYLAQQTDHLSQLEARYRTLIDYTPELVFSLDEAGYFNLVNRRWSESLGYTAEEGIGLHIENIIHPDHLSYWQDIFNQLQAGENVINQRLIFVTKSGQELIAEGDFIAHLKHGDLVAGQGRELLITLNLKNGHQVITFEDNGPGIAPENQTRVFEPFFTTKSRGIGLDLSIVKQIIEGHQGHISLGSKIGGGTKFTITLPLKSIPASGEEM